MTKLEVPWRLRKFIQLTTVTSKGQVTIPIEYRHWMGIHPGSRIQWGVKRGIAFLTPHASNRQQHKAQPDLEL